MTKDETVVQWVKASFMGALAVEAAIIIHLLLEILNKI